MKYKIIFMLLLLPLSGIRAQDCINSCNNVNITKGVPSWPATITHSNTYSLGFETGKHYKIFWNEPSILNNIIVSVNLISIGNGVEFEYTGGTFRVSYYFTQNTPLFNVAEMDFEVKKRFAGIYWHESDFEYKVTTTCFSDYTEIDPVTPWDAVSKFEVSNWISTAELYSPGGDEIWLDAGNYVALLPGFRTDMTGGGAFEAFIDGCGGSRSMEAEAPSTSTSNENRGSINVYPNPTTGSLNIALAEWENEMLDIRVTDVSGRIIVEQKIQASSTFNIDLSGYSKGIYLIMVSDGYQIKTSKAILE